MFEYSFSVIGRLADDVDRYLSILRIDMECNAEEFERFCICFKVPHDRCILDRVEVRMGEDGHGTLTVYSSRALRPAMESRFREHVHDALEHVNDGDYEDYRTKLVLDGSGESGGSGAAVAALDKPVRELEIKPDRPDGSAKTGRNGQDFVDVCRNELERHDRRCAEDEDYCIGYVREYGAEYGIHLGFHNLKELSGFQLVKLIEYLERVLDHLTDTALAMAIRRLIGHVKQRLAELRAFATAVDTLENGADWSA